MISGSFGLDGEHASLGFVEMSSKFGMRRDFLNFETTSFGGVYCWILQPLPVWLLEPEGSTRRVHSLEWPRSDGQVFYVEWHVTNSTLTGH